MRPVPTLVATTTMLIGALSAIGVAAAAPAATGSEDSVDALLLDFDGGTSSTPDLASSGSARVTTEIADANGGTVVRVDRPGGGAAGLEPFDDDAPAELAVLVVRPTGETDPFSPGRKPFSFGAAFRLDEVSAGSGSDNGNNLLQRGLYDDAAQYKLQVDDGHLSCRVRGAAGALTVTAGLAVTPGRWYRANCTREGDTVTLRLVERTTDGPVKRRWSRSAAIGSLTFSQHAPLAVGGKVDSSGKVLARSSDQFNGRVDNVFFRRLDG